MKRPPKPYADANATDETKEPAKAGEGRPEAQPALATAATSTVDAAHSPLEPQDRVGRKRVDPEALTQVIAAARLQGHRPHTDPTSLGNIARRAGVPSWDVAAALDHQAKQLRAGRPLLGDALVESGALQACQLASLLARQRAMRAGKPALRDALELLDLAIDRTMSLAGKLAPAS